MTNTAATIAMHGGPDGGPPIAHDFSTNANPLGPPPALWQAVQQADRRRYPDPAYRALRRTLAIAHGADPEQVLPASGGAEAIRRLTLAAQLKGLREVWVPQPGFGDYALAADALGLEVRSYANARELQPQRPALVWICEPRNPTGTCLGSDALAELAARAPASMIVVDCAYEPLRLSGEPTRVPDGCWQLHCPNKALGLTGIRAAYLLAPAQDEGWSRVLSLAPSWVLAAEGEAMLAHWHDQATQAWLAESRAQLRDWAASQRALLAGFNWRQLDKGCTPFWLAKPPAPLDMAALRELGIKLRDAASFGLAGWVRIAALPPQSQEALKEAL